MHQRIYRNEKILFRTWKCAALHSYYILHVDRVSFCLILLKKTLFNKNPFQPTSGISNFYGLCTLWEIFKIASSTKVRVRRSNIHFSYLAYPKDTLHLIFDLVHVRTAAVRMPTHQLEDGRHDISHLVASYVPIAVDVVQRERPLQLLVDGATRQCGQSVHEFLCTKEVKKQIIDV